MALILIIFFISLLVGQLGAITIAPGVYFYLHDIVIIVGLLVGLTHGVVRKKFARPFLFWPIVSFIGIGALSLALNYAQFDGAQIGQSALYLLRYAAYAAFYIVLVQPGITSSSFLLYGLFSFGTGLSVLGLVQYVLYPELRNLSYMGWDPHFYRLFSTLFDPNFVGIIIVFTFFLGLYIWKKLKQRQILLAQCINILALYLTYSRSSWGALIISGIVYIILHKQWKTIGYLGLFILAIIFVPKPGGNTLLLTRMDSTLARVGNWQESLGIISRSPLYGHGFNTLRFIPRVGSGPAGGSDISRAAAGLDSSILFLVATTGLVGVSVYGWLIYSMIQLSHINKKLRDQRVLLLSILVALLFHSLFTNSLFYPWVMLWLWVYVASCEITSGI